MQFSFATTLSFLLSASSLIPSVLAGSTFLGDATWYTPGLGSCGEYNTASDMIVALSYLRYEDGEPNPCGRRVKLRRGSKTVFATVKDKCMGCKHDDVDCSPAVFECMGGLGEGRFQMQWRWAGENEQ